MTSQEIHAVSWGSLLCISTILLTIFFSSLLQATGNAVISCIHAAHKKYESIPLDWQWVVEIGWHLFTKQDMKGLRRCARMGFLGKAIM